MDPDKQSDSTLEAAKATAAALGLNWTALDPIYRELQRPDDQSTGWLPKSSGRTIFTAHPNYVTRLLIGYGFRSPGITPHVANLIAHGLTPDGRSLGMHEWPSSGSVSVVEGVFQRLLTDPDAADEIGQLWFNPAEKSLTITHRNGGPSLRLIPATDGFWTEGRDTFRDQVREALALETGGAKVGSVVVIDGSVLSEIARKVNWRKDMVPVRPAHPGEADE